MEPLLYQGAHILSIIIFSPLLGVLALAFTKTRLAKFVASVSSLFTFALALLLYSNYDHGSSDFQFAERVRWMPHVGSNYIVGIDGLSLWLILLTTLLTALVILSSGSIKTNIKGYLSSLLLLEIGMLGTLSALDGLVFYVFWELMLVPMYFIIGAWGGQRRIYAAIKFVLFTAFGSLLMLVAMIYLAKLCLEQFGALSFSLSDWSALTLSLNEELLLFSAFALAFAIKIPVFPLHTWLPDAHVEAPTGGSVILAGILLKMGLYGFIRFCVPVFPLASVMTAPILGFLGVVGIIYGALVAWVQTDMKKLVAYSSVSHLGFCVLGYAVMSLQGFQGAMLQMINHGISTGALFFLVGVLYDRKHTREISSYGGVAAQMPRFAVVFALFTFSSIGLPLTNGFIGEFLILLGALEHHKWMAGFAVSGIVLGAVYMLSLYRRLFYGTFDSEKNGDLTDISTREQVVFAVLGALVFFIGLYPQPILRDLEPTASRSLLLLEAEADANDGAAAFGGRNRVAFAYPHSQQELAE